MDGLVSMLENGPWFIWNNLFIMKKWHSDENILKDNVSTIPVWVKLYGVPVTAFNDDGLSVIDIKLGTPLMLDSYTSYMCMQSWGRSSYDRVMVELRVDVKLKDNIVMAMPRIKGDGYYTCNICVNAKIMNNSESTQEVSKSKPFEVLTLVDNDVDLGTNEGISSSADKGTNNVSSSNTPIVPTGIVECDSEIEVVFDEAANLRILPSGKDGSDKGYGTNNLLEQRRDSYSDYHDYDPYGDDIVGQT
nr:hypothetical protein [Tanacetum cinerariifolium]